ncbi:MAG: hypothetical protein QM501_09500 [Gimesia sp.]
MKGPGLKLDLDVRRLWKCPQTGKTIRQSGNLVSKSVQVDGKEVFMQLLEEKRSLYRDPYHFDYFELAEEELSSSERAAAAARSDDENQTTEETAAPEQQALELDSATVETSEPDTLPETKLEEATDAESKTEAEPSAETEEDEDGFGGGVL